MIKPILLLAQSTYTPSACRAACANPAFRSACDTKASVKNGMTVGRISPRLFTSSPCLEELSAFVGACISSASVWNIATDSEHCTTPVFASAMNASVMSGLCWNAHRSINVNIGHFVFSRKRYKGGRERAREGERERGGEAMSDCYTAWLLYCMVAVLHDCCSA